MISQFTTSTLKAYRILSLSRTVFFYQPDAQRNDAVIKALKELAERYPRYVYKKLYQVIHRQGSVSNHQQVHRIDCLLKRNFRRKGKQRLTVRNTARLATTEAINRGGRLILCAMFWSVADVHCRGSVGGNV